MSEKTILLVSDAAELQHAFELALSFAGGIAALTTPTIQEALALPGDVFAILIDQDTWGLPGAMGSAQALRGRFPDAALVFIGDDLAPVVTDAAARHAGGDIRIGLPAPLADIFARLEAITGEDLPRVPMSLVMPVREALEDDASGEKTLADARVALTRDPNAPKREPPAIMAPPKGAPVLAPPIGQDASDSEGVPSLVSRVKRLRQTLDTTKRQPVQKSERLLPPVGVVEAASAMPAKPRASAVHTAVLEDLSELDMDHAIDASLDRTAESEHIGEALADAMATEGEREAIGSAPLSLESLAPSNASLADTLVEAVLEADRGRTGEGFALQSREGAPLGGDPWGEVTTRSYEEQGVDAAKLDVPVQPDVPLVEDAAMPAIGLPDSLDGTPVDGASRLLRTDEPVETDEPPAPPAIDSAMDDSGDDAPENVTDSASPKRPARPDFDEVLFSDEGTPVFTDARAVEPLAGVELHAAEPVAAPPLAALQRDRVLAPFDRFTSSLASEEEEQPADEPSHIDADRAFLDDERHVPAPPAHFDEEASLPPRIVSTDEDVHPQLADLSAADLSLPSDAPVRLLSASASVDAEVAGASSSFARVAQDSAEDTSGAREAALVELTAAQEARELERAALESRIATKNDEILALKSSIEARGAEAAATEAARSAAEARADEATREAQQLADAVAELRTALDDGRAREAEAEAERGAHVRALEQSLDDERQKGEAARHENERLAASLEDALARTESLSVRIAALERERSDVERRAALTLDETAAHLHAEVTAARAAAEQLREEHESQRAAHQEELRAQLRAQRDAFEARALAADEIAREQAADALRAERQAAEVDTLALIDELTREHEERLARAIADALEAQKTANDAERAQELARVLDEERAERERAVSDAVARALLARADVEQERLAHALEASRSASETELAVAIAELRRENTLALTALETRIADARAEADAERAERAALERVLVEEREERTRERAMLDAARTDALTSLEQRLEEDFGTRWRALERELKEAREAAHAELLRIETEKRAVAEALTRARAEAEASTARSAEQARAQAALADEAQRALLASLEESKADYARLVELVSERERARELERVQERSAFAEERERMTAQFEREADERARQAVAAELAAREHEEARLFAKLAFRRGSFDSVYENAREPLAVVGENAWEEADRLHQSAGEAPFRADTGAPLDPDVARPGHLIEPLSGSFGDGEIAGLLFSAFHLGTTGRLVVTDPSGQSRALYLENGEPVAFTSTIPRDRPEETLLRKGLITTRKHHELRAADALSARRLCGLLVEEKAMKPEELFAAIRGVLTEQVMSVLEWDEGRFAFDDAKAAPHDRVRLAQSMDALLAEAVRRKLSEERLWRIVGGPQTVLARDERAPRMPPLSPLELESATRFDGTRALEDVILDVGGPAEIPLRTAFLLVSCGALRVVARGLPRHDDERVRLVEDAVAIDRARIEDRQRLTREGDYFDILGVDDGATSTDVERAAHALRKRFAPERFQAPAFRDLARALVEICQVIDEARAVLSDPELRRSYQDRRRRTDHGARVRQQRA